MNSQKAAFLAFSHFSMCRHLSTAVTYGVVLWNVKGALC